MAATIKTENKTARQDTFRVVPSDVKEGRNSRMIPAANYADVVRERAVSIAKHGQLQPVEVRRLEDKTLELVYGFTRRDAVNLLRSGFTAIDPDTGEETTFHKPDATLWVKVTDGTADDAFLRSILENQERKDTTDLQEALAQNELRTTMGWTDTKIARFYGYGNQNRVMDLEKLLRLPKAVQEKVHEGKMALSVALLTLDLSDEERLDIINRSADAGGKVSGPALKNLLRDLYAKKAEAGEKTPTGGTGDEDGETGGEGEGETGDEDSDAGKKPKAIKRNVKDLERFFETYKDDKTAISDAGAELIDIMLKWFKGRRTDEYLRTAFLEYCR